MGVSLETPEKIRTLQRKLYVKAEREPKFLVRRHEVPGRGTRRFPDPWLWTHLGLVRLNERRSVANSHALT